MLGSLVIAAFLGALIAVDIAAYRSRRRFVRAENTFRCRARFCGYPSAVWPRLSRRWSRPMWAAWDDDMLVIRRGPVSSRIIVLRASVSQGVYTLPAADVRRCGPHPVAVCLLVWDGSRIEVAASGDSRLALVGPYLTAAVNDLPQAPVRRRQT
ncbi:hypothetical protein AB0J80_29255 [Actinoplanes sp. NPDC049548]|uniref:hypothetical protein n=1 Tax=Actinoplanes sp. NPDC049548 TaxID=3155152 RepID=UPI003420F066